MPKYSVQWVRRYHTAGVVIVEADNGDEAHDAVMDNLDEITSSMQAEDMCVDCQMIECDMHTYTDGDDVHVLREVI